MQQVISINGEVMSTTIINPVLYRCKASWSENKNLDTKLNFD